MTATTRTVEPTMIIVSNEEFDWLLDLLDKHPEPTDALIDEIMRRRPTLGKRMIEAAIKAIRQFLTLTPREVRAK